MDFLKKNWARIVAVSIAFAGFVLMLVPTFAAANITFFGASQLIGIILFFAGICVYLCLKMFEKTKTYAKYAMLCSSILVLLFMSLGLFGFSNDRSNAEGGFGTAYAMFRTASSDSSDGYQLITVNLIANPALATIDGSTTIQVALATLDGTIAVIQPADPATAELLTAARNGLQSVQANLGLANAATLAEAAEALGEARQDATAGALIILFAYISMILAFGLIPAVHATKKIVCTKE
ncbi:MAG: hypothetical protein FWC00_04750 [Firmicutes bacterium]|nr:hypothetical protein [Bacillota bacterium]